MGSLESPYLYPSVGSYHLESASFAILVLHVRILFRKTHLIGFKHYGYFKLNLIQ